MARVFKDVRESLGLFLFFVVVEIFEKVINNIVFGCLINGMFSCLLAQFQTF